MRILLFSCLALLAGCSATFDSKGDGGSGTTNGPGAGSGSGSDGNGDGSSTDSGGNGSVDDGHTGSISQLEDIKASMDRSATGCQDVDGISHAGAASYFYGELEPVSSDEGPQWRGKEEWILFANNAWKDTGVSDCVVTWSVQAEEVEPGRCAACDISVAVVATIDIARTSCPEGLYEGAENYSVQYDVRMDPIEEASQWFFADTGTAMGIGSYAGVAMNYLTDRSCLWF
jgi:hypothetical protein